MIGGIPKAVDRGMAKARSRTARQYLRVRYKKPWYLAMKKRRETLEPLLSADPSTVAVAKQVATHLTQGKSFSKKEIMRDAGLPASTKEFNKLAGKDSFRKVLEVFMPLRGVMERHKDLMEQDDELGVAAKMVELGYKVHGRLKEGNEATQTPFTALLAQISIENNYGGNSGTIEGQVVEASEPLQNQDETGDHRTTEI